MGWVVGRERRLTNGWLYILCFESRWSKRIRTEASPLTPYAPWEDLTVVKDAEWGDNSSLPVLNKE